MGGYRSYQSPEAYQSDSIGDLILQGGRDAAAGAQRSGDIWGRAISGAGQAVSQGLEQYGAEKKQKAAEEKLTKRDAAWLSYVDSGQWTKDPQEAYANSVRVFGPKDGAVQFQALQGASKLMQQDARDPAKDGQAAGYLIRGMGGLGNDEARKVLWPRVRELAVGAKLLDGTKAPEEFDPKLFNDVLLPMVPSLLGEKPAADQGFTLSPGQQRFGPGGESLAAVPAAPEKTPNLQTIETAGGIRTFNPQTGEMGPVVAQGKPREPRQAPQPSYQAKEVIGDDGKLTTANYDSRTGRYLDTSGNPIKNPRPAPSAADAASTKVKETAAPVLAAIYELSDKINVNQGLYAKAAGEVEKAKAKGNLNDDVAEYEALVESFTPQVARALGHTGVLTQRDVDSVKSIFPKAGDSKSLKDRKNKRIESLLGVKGAAPVKVSSPAEARKLPSGTLVQTPDGRTVRVP